MKTATRKIGISMFLAAGLFALAGVFANGLPASAQTQEPCPLPAGLTKPAPPRVTAEDVTDRGASLMDFALAVRERSVEHSQQATAVEEGLYIGCAIRQDDGIWRSGDTYIVTLTPDGRVFIHAKDMSLAGRQLNLSIYGAILHTLGINPADLANPATFLTAFTTAAMGNGGAFDIPNVPGASGYATVYVSPELQSPIVLLAGFDLNVSHLVQEEIQHVTPAITAEDVVDRATLKAFVTEAGNYMLDVQRTGDAAAASKARVALRDPNGPWRHGSVYLYVLDLNTNIITFHAAFPDRYENRPLTPTVRDAVTGEFILPQVIEAAKSDPEGGFVEYYFDDPDDHTDSADIPKVGYAREFAGQIQTADGRTFPVDIIVGSGFYGSAPEAVAEGGDAVVESVLPQVMRAMTASTVDAVSGRVERAISDTPPAATLSFGGASTLSDAILANGQALGNGTLDLSRLLAGSSFTMPLNAADNNGGGGLFGNLTFWGSGDYRSIAGGNPQSVDYDGSVVSANLGIDTRMGADMLAGVSVSQTRGTVDYSDSNADTGRARDLSDQRQPLRRLADGGRHEPVGHGRLWLRRGGTRR